MRRLSNRLLAIAGLAGSGECVADVGTDHGYLPIFLIEQGRMKRAIAMDVREGPLSRAQAHIRAHRLTDYIETRRSDGLAALQPGEAGVIVIAGMGGSLMSRILSQGEAVIRKETLLVLQPQSEVLEFRQFLMRQGYELLAEEMVKEDGKYYPMMKVQRVQDTAGEAASAMRDITDRDMRIALKYGPLLLRDHHPVLLEYLREHQKKQELIARRLADAATETAAERRRQICQELKELAQALEQYER